MKNKSKPTWLERHVPLLNNQNLGEEIANSVTHGIGVLLSVAALVLLVVAASLNGDAIRIVSFSIFGFTLINLYLSSTLYHAFPWPSVKRLFRILDHASIYLLIAGSYTPVCLIVLEGVVGWTLFGVVWGLAVLGILSKIFLMHKLKILSVVFFLMMGWCLVFVWKPLLLNLSKGMEFWLIAGGLCYSVGVVFYANKNLKYSHAIWHLFVMGGSLCHFFGMLFHLTSI